MSRILELISQLKAIEYELENTPMSSDVVCWWDELMNSSNKLSELYAHWKTQNESLESMNKPLTDKTKDTLGRKRE